jgi:hypothetical protein
MVNVVTKGGLWFSGRSTHLRAVSLVPEALPEICHDAGPCPGGEATLQAPPGGLLGEEGGRGGFSGNRTPE